MTKRFSSLLFVIILLLNTAGCDYDNNEPLPGAYRSTDFRIQTKDGDIVKVNGAGGSIEMTLNGEGRVEAGHLKVPPRRACKMLVGGDCTGDAELTTELAGTYIRDGDVLTFDLDSDTFIEDVRWTYDDAGTIRAGAIIRDHGIHDYVVFLQKRDDAE